MNTVRPDLAREELAALVCATLDRHGVRVVLSGGGAASIYAPNPYESMDLDFIAVGLSRKVDSAMHELGFAKQRQRHWTHPETRFWVEFPPGPVQVGDEVLHAFAERTTAFGTLRILTPTDCVLDRLAWFYYARDEQGLEQAVAVAAAHAIDLERVERWSARERKSAEFERFRTLLQAKV